MFFCEQISRPCFAHEGAAELLPGEAGEVPRRGGGVMGHSIGAAHDRSVAEIPRCARDRRRHLPALTRPYKNSASSEHGKGCSPFGILETPKGGIWGCAQPASAEEEKDILHSRFAAEFLHNM